MSNARERRKRRAEIRHALAKSKAAEAATSAAAQPAPAVVAPVPDVPEPPPEIRPPLTAIEQSTLALFAVFVTVLVLLAAFFTANRGADIDEQGMFNAAYMVAHYGKLAQPSENIFDLPVLAHPPIHIGAIGLLCRLGFTWYYSEGTPVAFLLLLTIWIVVRGAFHFPVKLGLLFGIGFFVATAVFFIAPFGTRPESAVHVTWFAGLLLLESGRLDRWNPWRLGGGAFLLTWASCVHFYAPPALAGIAVYLVWAARSLGWRAARRRILALAGGAMLFAVPYLALYVVPYWHSIVATVERSIQDRTGPSAVSAHLAFYEQWAGSSSAPGLIRAPLTLGIPLMLFSTAILGAIRGTRGIALAAAPLQIAIFFFASHKRPVYLVHEVEVFATALAVGTLVLICRLARRPFLPKWCHQAAMPIAVFFLCVYLVHATGKLQRPVLSTRPQIHEADLARATTRQTLGPHARVCGRGAVWYSGGGEYWHDDFMELVHNPTADPRGYLSRFDAAADIPYRSGESPKGTQRGLSYWYSTGLLKLRGFYMSQWTPDLRLVLLSLERPAKVSGYALRDDQLYRFDESPSGQHEVITAACPAGPDIDWPHLYPQASVVPLELPPTGPASPANLIIALTPRSSPEPAGLLERTCTVLGRIRGDESAVDKYALVDTLRRTDTPIRFARFIKDVPGPQQ